MVRYIEKFEETYTHKSLLVAPINEYNKTQTDKKTGGANYLRHFPLWKKNINRLLELSNKLIASAEIETMLPEIAACLTTWGHADSSVEKQVDEAKKIIERADYFETWIDFKFPVIQGFTLTFHSAEEKKFNSLTGFAELGSELNDISVEFDKPPVFTPRKIEKELEKTHTTWYLAHYLNLESAPQLAYVEFDWNQTALLSARVVQHRDLAGNRGLTFTSIKDGIVNTGPSGPIFISLEATVPTQRLRTVYQHLTIENPEKKDWLVGAYSAIVYIRRLRVQKSVCGNVLMHEVDGPQDLDNIVDHLERLADKPVPGHQPEDEKFSKGIQARHMLREKVTALPQPDPANPSPLTPYVGCYSCYYIRLTFQRANFELNFITLRSDGSALLEQYGKNPVGRPGYYQVEAGRIRVHFGQGHQPDTTPIQFILYKEPKQADQFKLLGTYQSETSEGQPVSGLVSLTRQPDSELIPSPVTGNSKKTLSRACSEVTAADFCDDEDFAFFLGEAGAGLSLTDGPAWAEISERISKDSAYKTIRSLCTKPGGQHAFSENHFYYYTFKKGSPTETDFLIERSLLVFNRNGTVTMYADSKNYVGNAYHWTNTLHLSLKHPEEGLLEMFFELDRNHTNLPAIRILYGASLWHSSKRIQAKAVVLSRYAGHPTEKGVKMMNFNDSEGRGQLQREDDLGGGVISYLRGETNRYLHGTTSSSPGRFRPRDKSSREIHFWAACGFGFLSREFWKYEEKDTKHPEKKPVADEKDPPVVRLLKDKTEDWRTSARTHLHAAFVHGFAVNFGGLEIDYRTALGNPAEIADAYLRKFFPGVSYEEKAGILKDQHTEISLQRIGEITGEQALLKKAFESGGPLHDEELRKFASDLWPDIFSAD
ncbi:hypothetical protein GCM10023091_36250 [Ravibacter arvi]|uniref:Uncharacterized protein n=1 Tax=Ravibacter arvi TaxID=2051041 RepID=A0ABP8M674_9BACT